METAIKVTLLVLVVLFSIGTITEKDKKVANRLMVGVALCVAGVVTLQILG